MQLGTSGWYTRVSARSIPPWSTHQQADPWHWIFSNSPSSVHLGWYTPNSPCLLLSNCKTQGFRPVPYQREKLTSLDIIQTIISSLFFFYHIMKHIDRFDNGTTLALPFLTSVLCFIAFPNISLCMSWIYAKYCSAWKANRLVLGRLKQTIMWYTSSITTGMSFLFFSCRLKIFPGGSLTLVSQASVWYYT